MVEYYILGYTAALMIGVAAWVVHITAQRKQLPSKGAMQKQRSTTIFLGLVLLFNFSDLFVCLCPGMMGEMGEQWVLIGQNVLEVVIVYAIIEMERCMAGAARVHWVDIGFVAIGLCILFCDILELEGGFDTEASYVGVMIILNAIPILFLIGMGFDYWKVLRQTEERQAHITLLIYNVLCVLMGVIATASIADARTSYDFFLNDGAFYVIMWLAFNTANLFYVWHQTMPYAEDERPLADEERPQNSKRNMEEVFEKYGLSEREREIAIHLINGRNNKEIAAIMYLSPNTVKVHASNLYRKLGVANRVQAVRALTGEKVESGE